MTTSKEANKIGSQIPKKLQLYIKFLQATAPRSAKNYALNLFFTPIKHPTPEREFFYRSSANIYRETVNGKGITVYQTGISKKKILLVHGWSGRATQFYTIAPALTNAGFKVYTFTAPAHGTSTDKQTNMNEFADCITYMQGHHGPFDAIVAHSIGGTATLNAINQGLEIKKAVLIGSPGYIKNVVQDFCHHMGFKPFIEKHLIDYLKSNYAEDYEQFSVTRLAEKMTIPALIIHDEDDQDVSVKQARQNHKAWKNSEYLETKGLGHRLILSDDDVIKRIVAFLT